MTDELLVVCNGPSLADVDLDFLKSRPSFGANGVYLLDGFTPAVYFATDQAFIINREKELCDLATRTASYVRRPWNDRIPGSKPFCRVTDHMWSYSPLHWVGSGGTVTFIMLQFALASDAQKILVVGLDHDYFAAATRPEHFHEEYLKGIEHPFDSLSKAKKLVYWKNQKKICDAGYEMANTIFANHDKEIINLTPSSQCDAFERGDIEDYA